MTSFLETNRKLLAAAAVDHVRSSARELVAGSHEAVWSFLSAFVDVGQDEGPRFRLDNEVLKEMIPRERAAMRVGKHFSVDFIRNFGPMEYASQGLSWGDESLSKFFVNLGKTVLGVMEPTGEYGSQLGESLVGVSDAYTQLIEDANERGNTPYAYPDRSATA